MDLINKILINNKYLKNFIFLALSQGINQLIPLLITPLLLSKIGSNAYGQYATFQYILLYMGVFVNFGFLLSATKNVATMSLHRDVSILFSCIFYSKLINFIGIIGLFLLGLYFFPPAKHFYLSYASGAIITGFGYIFYQDWLFQGKKIFIFQFICILVSKIIYLLLLFIGIKWFYINLYYLIFIDSISILLMGLISHFIICNLMKIKLKLPHFPHLKEVWKEAANAFTGIFLISFFTSINVILLGFFCSPEEVAVYSIADRVFILLSGSFAIASRVLFPDLAKMIYHSEMKYNAFFKKALYFISIGVISISIITLIFEKLLFVTLLAKTIPLDSVTSVLNILLIALIFQTLSSLYSYQFILKLKYKTMNYLLMIVSFSNILVAFIVIPKFGAIGAASITAFSFFIYYLGSVITQGFTKSAI